MKAAYIVFGFALCAAGVSLAHTGVTNPAVLARMDSMVKLGDGMKVLVGMAKGEMVFNAAAARAAAAQVARHAAETPALFEAKEDDPRSEAREIIWTDFADFTVKSDELVVLAEGFAKSIQSEEDVRAAATSIGLACLACHQVYRTEHRH
ncbi:MAG: cytochrome c [Pseudomonadota bacterium]